MKFNEEFYVVVVNDTEICYGEYPELAIYTELLPANERRADMHFKFPSETYTVEKIKIEKV